jgi:hypothetical protein
MIATSNPLPMDYFEWRTEWSDWLQRNQDRLHHLRERSPFRGKNFLADEVLGVWRVNGRTVELSSVTFPNFEDRDPVTGRLLEGYKRRIGITFEDGTDVVDTFAELERVLGLVSA